MSKAAILPLLVVLGQTPAAIPTERPDPGRAEDARELLRKGEAFWRMDELTQAKGALDEALDLGQRLSDREIEATALRLLGRAFDSQGDGAHASALLERALGLAQATADEPLEARILDDLLGVLAGGALLHDGRHSLTGRDLGRRPGGAGGAARPPAGT